jgi:uncharacterized protein YndB with AHSA1/START domain
MIVPTVSLVAIPIAAFAIYALGTDPPPRATALTWLAFVPVLIAFGAGISMILFMARARATLTGSALRFLSNGTAVVWGGVVLGISDLVYLYEPVLAVGNLVLNAAWVVFWIPRSPRRVNADSSTEVLAPPARVFAFIAEPANWTLYQEDLELVTARPAGPLAIGSEVTLRMRVPVPVRVPRWTPSSVETRAVITEVVPDRLIALREAERPENMVTIELEPVKGGTRVVSRAPCSPFGLPCLGS